MNIGDLFLGLFADGSKLEPQVVAEASKAGDAGAKTLGQKLSAGLKTGGVKALAGAFSLAGAAATAGALQMEDAVARIRSETGASQDEAEKIAQASNRIAGDQQQSLAAVSDVAIAIKKNMGATGDQLDKLTEQTVKYARVTKQDGVGAVKAFDDIVDAFGLSLEQVGQVQDQLIVSNHKYGGSIEENQAALAKMAPQLKALNLDYNDGIELLNLFAASGLDAADGQKALNQAITKLPKGETLDQFIKRLSQVTDDGERARLAIEVFGAKSGAKLANAIKPGIDSLDQFGVSATEAAGATDQAVDDLDSSLGGRLRKVLSQAKAALRGFGADFGSAITAAASVGSLATALGVKLPLGPFVDLGKKLGGRIVEGIGAAFVGQAGAGIVADGVAGSVEAAAGSGRLSSALGVLGKFMGTTLGKAAGAGFALALLYAAEEEWKKGANDFFQLPEDAGQGDRNNAILDRFRAAGGQIAGETEAVKSEVQAAIGDIGADAVAAMRGVGEHAGSEFTSSAAQGVKDGAPQVSDATVTMVDDATAAAGYAANKAAYEAGKAIPDNTAAGIRSRRQTLFDAFDQLKEDLKNALNPMKEQAKLVGILTSKEMAAGLRSGDPVARRQAQELRTGVLNRLNEIYTSGKPIGKKAAQFIADGLKSKDPQVRATAQQLAKIVEGRLDSTVPQAGQAGRNAGNAFEKNLRGALPGTIYIDVRTRGKTNDKGKAVGGPVLAGTPYLVNEHTPRSEIFVPSVSGRIVTHAQAVQALQSGGGGGAGPTYNIPIAVTGILAARKPDDLARPLRQLAASGALRTPADRRRMQVPRRG